MEKKMQWSSIHAAFIKNRKILFVSKITSVMILENVTYLCGKISMPKFCFVRQGKNFFENFLV